MVNEAFSDPYLALKYRQSGSELRKPGDYQDSQPLFLGIYASDEIQELFPEVKDNLLAPGTRVHKSVPLILSRMTQQWVLDGCVPRQKAKFPGTLALG
jgi:hypothetical protein